MNAVALVTGGANGIGAATARRYAAHGAHVVVADLDRDAGIALASEIDGLFVEIDVAHDADNIRAVDAAVDTYGRLDVAVLNAGVGGAGGGLDDDFDLDRYRRTLATNIDGTIFGIRAVTTALTASGGGAIVVTSSLGGIGPVTFDPVYAASKHAIIGLVRSLAPACAARNITLNAICPGFVATDLLGHTARAAITAHGLTIAGPGEIVDAITTIQRSPATGEAFTVRAGQQPRRITFPTIELS